VRGTVGPRSLQAGLSYTEVGRALKISESVVGKYVSLARAAGVDWEVAQTLSNEDLDARLFRPAVPRSSHHLAPDFALVHQELNRISTTNALSAAHDPRHSLSGARRGENDIADVPSADGGSREVVVARNHIEHPPSLASSRTQYADADLMKLRRPFFIDEREAELSTTAVSLSG
jgi:hypothetical protein